MLENFMFKLLSRVEFNRLLRLRDDLAREEDTARGITSDQLHENSVFETLLNQQCNQLLAIIESKGL